MNYPNQVTMEYIEDRIASVNYHMDPHDDLCTICTIRLDNGFTVRGESKCMDTLNFSKSMGEEVAYDNAFDRLWELFGFLFTDAAYQSKQEKIKRELA